MHRQLPATDASQVGWGAIHAGLGILGTLTYKQLNQHINALELQAIHLAFLQFLPCLQGARYKSGPTAQWQQPMSTGKANWTLPT